MNVVAQDSGKQVPSAPGQLAPMGYLGALRRQLEDRYPAQPMHQVRTFFFLLCFFLWFCWQLDFRFLKLWYYGRLIWTIRKKSM